MEQAPNTRMYSDLAKYWPLISAPEDYAPEAAFWLAALRDHLGPGKHALLELGVGGGNNLSHFAAEFDVVAVDLSAEMLVHSRRINPSVEHHVGDMRTVRVDRTFDAVIIHDAINYITTEDDLLTTFRNAFDHLRSGGIFITSPDFTCETFHPPFVEHTTRRNAETELTYLEYTHDPDPADTAIETIFFFIIREQGQVHTVEDRHTTGLFPHAMWLSLLERAGFEASTREYPVHDDERQAWLFVGRKP
ncbi:class I SAM-dependent methyltransferase [bacterium]|nr:class I SAM-dependent methyltransferase [bacterium]